MSIIMKNQGGYRRAHFITQDEAEKLVKAGKAFKHGLYDIYEESDATYTTKVMEPVKAKRRKASDDEADK